MPPKKAPSSSGAESVPAGTAGKAGAINDVGISVTVKLIKSQTDVYRGLYVRLIGQGIESSISQVRTLSCVTHVCVSPTPRK